jgi:hypothetical protein
MEAILLNHHSHLLPMNNEHCFVFVFFPKHHNRPSLTRHWHPQVKLSGGEGKQDSHLHTCGFETQNLSKKRL